MSNSCPIPKSNCPYCGASFDRSMDILDESPQPKPGDIAICASCGCMGVVTEELKLRFAYYDDFASLPEDYLRQAKAVQQAIRDSHGEPPDHPND